MTPSIDVRDERQPGHFWADNEVYTKFGPAIGIDGFAVYMALCQYANKDAEAWPSVGVLAKQLDAAPNTIRKALIKLKDAGLITITERPRDTSRKVAQTNVYTLLKIDKTCGTSPDAVPQVMKGGTSPDAGGVLHDVKGNKTNKNKTQGISGGDTREDATPAAAELSRIGFDKPQTAIALKAIPDLTCDDVAAWDAWLPTSDKDNPLGFMVWALGRGQRRPSAPLKRAQGHTNGLAPPPPDGTPEERQRRWEQYTAEMDAAEGIAPP